MYYVPSTAGVLTQYIARVAKYVTSHKLLPYQPITLPRLDYTSSLFHSCFPALGHQLPCSDWRVNTKCSLCRWSGEQKPPGDLLGLEEHQRQQMSLLTGDHTFTWSRAPSLLRSARGERPRCWMKCKQSDGWSGKCSGHSERFRINLFSTAEDDHTCPAHLGAVLHHSWLACSPFSGESHLFGAHWVYALCLRTSVDRQEEILQDT